MCGGAIQAGINGARTIDPVGVAIGKHFLAGSPKNPGPNVTPIPVGTAAQAAAGTGEYALPQTWSTPSAPPRRVSATPQAQIGGQISRGISL
jgi:hypothetical protein